MRFCFLILMLLPALNACRSVPSPSDRFQQAMTFAAEHQWQSSIIEDEEFDLMTFAPSNLRTDLLTIYIEGDGLAWLADDMPSTDPTPINFLGLRLAIAQPEGAAAYLARPCQYVSASHAQHCSKIVWTDARFSAQVVDAMNKAVGALKQRSQARQIILIGYSGGGAIAALIAARRDDIHTLITIAGNLDTAAWSSQHHLWPLSQSLNPIDDAQRLKPITQLHLVGLNDEVVPIAVAESYAQKIKSPALTIRTFDNFDHVCCWERAWPQIWQEFIAVTQK